MALTLKKVCNDLGPVATLFGWRVFMNDDHDALLLDKGGEKLVLITAEEANDGTDGLIQLLIARLRKLAYGG